MSLKKYLIYTEKGKEISIQRQALRLGSAMLTTSRSGQALRLRSGQAALEYFVIFSLIAALTILSLSNTYSKDGKDTPTGFLSKVKRAGQMVFQDAAARIKR